MSHVVAFGALVAIRPGSGALAILWLIGICVELGGGTRLLPRIRSAARRWMLAGGPDCSGRDVK